MQNLLLISATCAVLVACGGGGGSSSADNSTATIGPAVALSGANYEAATKEVLDSVASLQAASDPAILTGVQMNSSLTSPSALLQSKLPELSALFKQDTRLTGAVVQRTVPCDGGGYYTVFVNDTNNNQDLDAGDNGTLSFAGCRLISNEIITGKLTLAVNSGRTYNGEIVSTINISVMLEGFTTQIGDVSAVANGTFGMTATPVVYGASNIRVVTPLLTNQVTQAGTTKVFQFKNYSVDATGGAYSASFAVNGNVSVPTLGANTAEVKTIERFAFTSGMTNTATTVTSGKLEIAFRDGGKVRVTALGETGVKIELDRQNDGIYEESKTISWMDML